MKTISTILSVIKLVLKYSAVVMAVIAGIQTVADKLEQSGLIEKEKEKL